MTFYPCQNQDLWININHIKAITIEKFDEYEIRAYAPEDNGQHFLLEKFGDK